MENVSHDPGTITQPPSHHHRRRNPIAIVLVVLGVVFLLKELSFFSWINWGIVWPIVVILLGVYMLRRHR